MNSFTSAASGLGVSPLPDGSRIPASINVKMCDMEGTNSLTRPPLKTYSTTALTLPARWTEEKNWLVFMLWSRCLRSCSSVGFLAGTRTFSLRSTIGCEAGLLPWIPFLAAAALLSAACRDS